MKPCWDIFCRVVDNYGDIGVTWRLARQLVAEQACQVRLWVDELAAFARICPGADVAARCQWHAGVEVRAWDERTDFPEPGQVVIEAFACELPAAFVAAMARRPGRLWLNLEYLSAEPWVSGCHGLPSPQADGQAKYFFFPGFRPDTGGLLRERGLLSRCQAFRNDDARRSDFLARLGVPFDPRERRISLFTYENPELGGWLALLAEDETTLTRLLVPEGRVLGDLRHWLEVAELRAGDCLRRGQLEVHILPFLAQDDYDDLLCCCDFNLVRGEDSFLRAQWVGLPWLWHIYRQEEEAHLVKLEAFLELYLRDMPGEAAAALRGFWLAWNRGEELRQAWSDLCRTWGQQRRIAGQWAFSRGAEDDLATRLVQFCSSRL